jgi:hypothetical protein
MKTKLLALTLLGASAMFAQTRFSIGVGVGAPVAPVAPAYNAYGYDNYGYDNYDYGYYDAPPAYAVVPPAPGPDYFWVGGSWFNLNGHRSWRNGRWDYRPRSRGASYRNNFRYERGHDRGHGDRDRHDHGRH